MVEGAKYDGGGRWIEEDDFDGVDDEPAATFLDAANGGEGKALFGDPS